MTSIPGACRSCGAPLAERVLDLGEQPASDFFPAPGDDGPDPLYPLVAWVCTTCWLVQLTPGVGPDEEPPLAVESATSRRLAGESSAAVVKETGLAPGATVIEIASHHGGHWLPSLAELGLVAAPAGARADLVVDVHGLAHEEDIAGAVAAHAGRVAADGHLVLEFHHLLPLVTEGQFDTVRHGHPVYLSLLSLSFVLARNGLTVTSVFRSPAYGGSLRVTARPTPVAEPDDSVAEVLAAERAAGLDDPAALRRLQERASRAGAAIHAYLVEAKAAGRRVLGYGAPSKAPILLRWSGVDVDLLPSTADISPAKHGRRLPGSAIPITAPADLLAARPDDVLILTWDIAGEIAAQLPEVRGWGGRFVVPVPEPHVLD